jgi:hypothetical protein
MADDQAMILSASLRVHHLFPYRALSLPALEGLQMWFYLLLGVGREIS